MCSAVDFSSPVPILLRQRASSWGNLPFLELLLRGRLSETQTVLLIRFCHVYLYTQSNFIELILQLQRRFGEYHLDRAGERFGNTNRFSSPQLSGISTNGLQVL